MTKKKTTKPDPNEITLEKCQSKEAFEKINFAKQFIDRGNELLKMGQMCVDPKGRILKGTFVADMTGLPGIGIKDERAGYTHLFGKALRSIEKHPKKGEIKHIFLDIEESTEDIEAFFKSLKFYNPKEFISL